MIIYTFTQWNSLGFDILKGSKAVTFIEGEAYFNEDQVTPKKYRHVSTHSTKETYNEEESYYDSETMPRAMESEADFYGRKSRACHSGDGWGPMGQRS